MSVFNSFIYFSELSDHRYMYYYSLYLHYKSLYVNPFVCNNAVLLTLYYFASLLFLFIENCTKKAPQSVLFLQSCDAVRSAYFTVSILFTLLRLFTRQHVLPGHIYPYQSSSELGHSDLVLLIGKTSALNTCFRSFL